jgi:predicted permease
MLLYRALMTLLLPYPVRRDYGDDMTDLLQDRLAAAAGPAARLGVHARAVADLTVNGLALRRTPHPAPSTHRPDSDAPQASTTTTHGGARRPRQPKRSPMMNGTRWIESFLRDLRHGVRVMRRDPGFAFTAVVTLALAIGINTAVFGIVDATFLRPLPYAEPDRLAMVVSGSADSGITPNRSQHGFTWEVLRGARSFDAAIYSGWLSGVNLVNGGDALYVQQQRVGAGYFEVLGIAPLLGREFLSEEDVPDGPKVVVLGNDLWRRGFGADQGIVGESILLRGEPYTVVGVMGPDVVLAGEADLWTPLRPSTEGEGGGQNYTIIARLAEGASWPEARAEIAGLAPAVNETQPAAYGDIAFDLTPLQEALGRDAEQPLRLLWAVVALVFIVACVNLAGLLLVRTDRRRAEIATRLAIGGSRGAIVRQLVTEGFVLACAGAALGAVVAAVVLSRMRDLGSEVIGAWRPVTMDGRLGLAVVLLALLATGIFALVPMLMAGRLARQEALAARGLKGVAGPGAGWARRALLVGQVTIAVVLLAGAGLLLRTYVNLVSLEPGFDPTGVQAVRVSFQDARYETRDAVASTLQEGADRLRRLPGAVSAGATLGLPYERLLNLGFQVLDGGVDPKPPITNLAYVTEGFFETMKMPMVQGRGIDETDRADSNPVVVVNEAFAREYLTDGWVLGRRLATGGAEREIVGVVGDAQQRPSWGDFSAPIRPQPSVYIPVSQTSDGFLQLVHGWFAPAWVVRLDGAVDRRAIEEAIAGVDPLLPLAAVESLEEVRNDTLAPQRLLMVLLASMATAAVFLAALGIHGLVAASVNERTREMGIRVALGATPGATLRAIAIPAMVLAGVGAVLGCLGAAGATRIMASMLFGVSAVDPATFAGVVALLLLVAAVASLLPALRILRLDPATSLRAE